MFQSLYNYISVITEWWFNKPDHVFLPNVIAYCQQNRYVWLAIYTGWFTLRKLIYETLKNRCNFCASNTYWFLHIVDSKLEKVDYYHFNVHTAWKVSVLRVFLVRIFLYSEWIRTRKTPNTEIFHAVPFLS